MSKQSQTVPDVPEALVRQTVQDLDIFDDTFARFFFNKKEVAAEVLKNITGKEDIVIEDVKVQKTIDNIENHSVVLDVFVRDKKRNIYNIELQRRNAGANKKRVRYYSGMMESEALKKESPTLSCLKNGRFSSQKRICSRPDILSII